jgi:two-component system cell cycle sensor histidine kinase/response regulator CckA
VATITDEPVCADLVRNAPDQMYVVSRAGRILYANQAADASPAEALVGTGISEQLSGDPAAFDAASARVLASGQPEEYAFSRGQASAERWYRCHIKRGGAAGAHTLLLFVSDVTEQRAAEGALRATVRELEESRRQMAHAQKMQSLGRLAGGVAHDFNNLLTAIISFTRFVMDDMSSKDPRRADLVEVLKAADTAAKLTRQLLAFSRNQSTEPLLTELNAAITRFGRVLDRTLEESIHLRVVESPAPVQVMCDPGHLDQLVMNLVVNARDAMPKGGTITVEVGQRVIESHAFLPQGAYATLSVTDTGEGMTPEVLSQVFEPFFTTKGERGTGLGLATCYGIVQQARGDIEVESHRGFGSKFTVLWPLAEGAEVRAVSAPPAAAPTHNGTSAASVALVVEDQPAIRRSMMRSLQRAGFNVIDAASAEEALSVVEELKARVDLLVTDIVLPGLDGIKLAQRLRGTHPDLRVLVCSGYSGKSQFSDIEGQPQTAFLPKPFTGADLVARASALFG